jgi:predicted DsbA family dithiol-disulfide isomerase
LIQPITIDIYSDTICPWCYIGHNQLLSAINSASQFKFDLVWRPFQLNPDMPVEGMERQQYLEVKFGGKQKAKDTYQSIYNEGIENSIHFQFEKIVTTPNSFASHKLLAIAHRLNKQSSVVEALFYSYFIEGIDIGNMAQLIIIAKQHNIYDDTTLQYLKSDEDRDNLLAEELQARELGIKGVPCFIINRKFVLLGAHDKNKFLDIFNKINK